MASVDEKIQSCLQRVAQQVGGSLPEGFAPILYQNLETFAKQHEEQFIEFCDTFQRQEAKTESVVQKLVTMTRNHGGDRSAGPLLKEKIYDSIVIGDLTFMLELMSVSPDIDQIVRQDLTEMIRNYEEAAPVAFRMSGDVYAGDVIEGIQVDKILESLVYQYKVSPEGIQRLTGLSKVKAKALADAVSNDGVIDAREFNAMRKMQHSWQLVRLAALVDARARAEVNSTLSTEGKYMYFFNR